MSFEVTEHDTAQRSTYAKRSPAR